MGKLVCLCIPLSEKHGQAAACLWHPVFEEACRQDGNSKTANQRADIDTQCAGDAFQRANGGTVGVAFDA